MISSFTILSLKQTLVRIVLNRFVEIKCNWYEPISIVLAQKSYSDSSFATVQNGFQGEYIEASDKLNQKILDTAATNHMKI